jgi:hypothetical protein
VSGQCADSTSRAAVAALITGCWSTQVIHAAVSLGIIDALGCGAQRVRELAGATGTDASSLQRLLRALCVLELARQEAGTEAFALTEGGSLLRRDVPGSLQSLALHWGSRTWPGLAHLPEAVRTGAAWPQGGRDGFAKLGTQPAKAAIFNRAMVDQTLAVAHSILEAYDFSPCTRTYDVGGGYGALLAALLERYPRLTGASLDLGYMEADAQHFLARAGLAGRARFIACDFFESVPTGADCYLLKYILHDWGDAECEVILRHCREAAGRDGRIVVIEQLAPDVAQPGPQHLHVIRSDINMLAVTGGRERTHDEYRALFEAAGLALTRVVPSGSSFSLLEGRREPRAQGA